MNISKYEQRVLHVLAQGGYIRQEREQDSPKISNVTCFTSNGMILSDCTLKVFKRLRRRRLIQSKSNGPYRISKLGRTCVRAQLDNRG